MSAPIKQRVAGSSAHLLLEMSGKVTPRKTQKQLDDAQRAGRPPVNPATAITSTQSSGNALRDVNAVLTDLGLINDQSRIGAGDGSSYLDVEIPNRDIAMLHVGDVPTWSGQAWVASPAAIGSVLQFEVSQDAADNATITAVSTYQVLCTTAITLPIGTWSIRVALDLVSHQGSGFAIALKINVGGTASGTTWSGGTLAGPRTLVVSSSSPGTWAGMSATFAGVAGGGVVNIFAGAITPSGGTMTAQGPRMLIGATRTA